MKRRLLIVGSTTVLVTLVALPSWALISTTGGSSNSLISPFLSLLQTQFGELKNQLSNQMTQWLGNTGSQYAQIGLNMTMGEMGMPDLQSLEEEIKKVFTQENGEQAQVDEAINNSVREVTRTKAEGTLSEDGQEAVKERLENTQKTTDQIDTQAQEAQNETVTQNVLKKIALQNAQTGVLLGSLNSEITDLSVKQDLANQNLTNISEAIDSQNLAQQADQTSAAASLLHLSSMLTLR
ncbi:hypothetical protein C7H19_19925 [Aphanothece hegewaldii CCALA 016]|uniref:Uncharacterized protein n=1 Tax=Aphanothece hegewaldii CCALA 016 TaxID=2107694 RepID=A0A2T1LT11_9CHRO|nr:hypothetical protein [Aphanothece hegewaldii]PSF33441.1 hypothetical protein C7H19_19925 [Aphanothece hegewaldii CCALA 016]